MDKFHTLTEVKLEFWYAAWLEFKRVGLIEDGIYERQKDADLICMYCNF